MERRSVGWRSESANASTFHRFDVGRPVVIQPVATPLIRLSRLQSTCFSSVQPPFCNARWRCDLLGQLETHPHDAFPGPPPPSSQNCSTHHRSTTGRPVVYSAHRHSVDTSSRVVVANASPPSNLPSFYPAQNPPRQTWNPSSSSVPNPFNVSPLRRWATSGHAAHLPTKPTHPTSPTNFHPPSTLPYHTQLPATQNTKIQSLSRRTHYLHGLPISQLKPNRPYLLGSPVPQPSQLLRLRGQR